MKPDFPDPRIITVGYVRAMLDEVTGAATKAQGVP